MPLGSLATAMLAVRVAFVIFLAFTTLRVKFQRLGILALSSA